MKTRVYDSLGRFITNMADPYLQDTAIKYFSELVETLGKVRTKFAPIDSFKVREFGANDSIPYNIALTVDYSGSMSPIMSAIFEGTELFIQMKYPYDKIALTTFNKDFDIKAPLLQDKDSLLSLFRSRRDRGEGIYTAAYDALWNCIKLFDETPPDDPRVLVIFTDGDDNYSKQKVSDLIDKAKEKKIHIFTVAFGYSKDDNLKDIAKYTGGKYYKAYTKEQMVSIFRDIYMSLRYHYLVTYKPPMFWGYHGVCINLNIPALTEKLTAYGEYDTSDMYNWNDVGNKFERPILFDFDSANIKPETIFIIDEIAEQMFSNPRLKLEIQGHTDNKGTIEYNQVLSEKRANNVMNALVEKGVELKRLRARGFGFSVPKVPNTSEENCAINRRTEFHILAK